MTHETTAPAQSLVDDALNELENMADDLDGTYTGRGDGDGLRRAAELIRQQQAQVEQMDGFTHNLIGECERLTAERDRLAERCRELGLQLEEERDIGSDLLSKFDATEAERDTLRTEVERLTALQLPPDHLPMPRRMLELLIGDPQNPYRANAESVASEMLSGALPDPESHEREFNAVRNVRLLLSEIDRLRAELNTRPGPGMRLCTACKAYHPAENFDPGMACCRAANERNPVYFVRLPDGSMEMHHKAQEASR